MTDTTKPPVVRLQFSEHLKYFRDTVELSIFVNEQLVACGTYGGEPEDNTRSRDYAWVEGALEMLAISLGATVEVVEVPDA